MSDIGGKFKIITIANTYSVYSAYFIVLCKCYINSILTNQPYEVCTIFILILLIRKLRHREVKVLIQQQKVESGFEPRSD